MMVDKVFHADQPVVLRIQRFKQSLKIAERRSILGVSGFFQVLDKIIKALNIINQKIGLEK